MYFPLLLLLLLLAMFQGNNASATPNLYRYSSGELVASMEDFEVLDTVLSVKSQTLCAVLAR